ncbi:MAG: RNA-binding S4 domain-containing protein [Streptococcaceae bacterium]|jgi:ribosomal 50S subunit-recycling heat shock protein|nr:RNA-binding S4 domain-containing protein [Streptococcaceae bacterium]
MRIDKFLKASRLIKRRSIAKEVTDKGRIKINDIVAKSSTNVEIGDIILICFGNKQLKVKILALLESTKKKDAGKMYEIICERNAN